MPPRLSEAEIEKLRVLYEESPLSVPALIRETGHSHRTIYYYAARRGWKSRAARRSARLPRAEIRALYEDTIVPVAEIARLAGVAVPTIHVWAARDGWKPRATRLRRKSAPAGEIADLAAEVAAARERAERECEWRELRALDAGMRGITRVLVQERREKERAAREREKKPGTYKRVWYSPQELVAHGLPGTARVYLPRPEPAARPDAPQTPVCGAMARGTNGAARR